MLRTVGQDPGAGAGNGGEPVAAPSALPRIDVDATSVELPEEPRPHRAPHGDPSLMFSHLMVSTNDLDRAKKFYDPLLGTLGVPAGAVDRHRIFWRSRTGAFSVSLPIDGQAATIGNGSTVGFACDSPAQVDAWHAAGLANGGTPCEDPPGVRAGPTSSVYLAYLRDPDGNKICGMFRMPRT